MMPITAITSEINQSIYCGVLAIRSAHKKESLLMLQEINGPYAMPDQFSIAVALETLRRTTDDPNMATIFSGPPMQLSR